MTIRLMDCTDAELAVALHFVDGHDTDLEGFRARAWIEVKAMLLGLVEERRDINQENERG